MKRLDWNAAKSFTFTMFSKDLPVVSTFRSPLATVMGRDVLAIDIPLKRLASSDERDVLRLCNTQLEAFQDTRHNQLVSVSKLLKDDAQMGCNVLAGLVAGDMYLQLKIEHQYPKADDIQLQDAWENGPEEATPKHKPGQKDLTNGRARGNTWGYQQDDGSRRGARRDKILYTGSLQGVPLIHGQELTRGIRRLGIGLKATVKACKVQGRPGISYWGPDSPVTRMETRLFNPRAAERLIYGDKFVETHALCFASDQYGIMAQFRLTANRAQDAKFSAPLEPREIAPMITGPS